MDCAVNYTLSLQEAYADEAEWERRREQITDLYFNQDKTLQQVIDTMKYDHLFFAT